MAIHGWSGDCQSNFGVQEYSDRGGGIAVALHGWSEDYQSNFGVRGYSDIGGEAYSSGYPWRVAIHGRSGVCQSNFGVRGYSDIGGGISVAIHGWSGVCQSNSSVWGYWENMSDNPCTTMDCQSNSGLQSGDQTDMTLLDITRGCCEYTI